MKLIFENPNTGIIKKAPIGFSWTTLFFCVLPALFRGDMKWFCIQFVIAIFTGGLSTLVFAFIYNKIYIQKLLERGYKVKEVQGGTLEGARQKLGINFPAFPTAPAPQAA
jgi:hypothetical protein